MCKDGKKCFIALAKECCFNNAENGLKVCKCGLRLPKNQYEIENWENVLK